MSRSCPHDAPQRGWQSDARSGAPPRGGRGAPPKGWGWPGGPAGATPGGPPVRPPARGGPRGRTVRGGGARRTGLRRRGACGAVRAARCVRRGSPGAGRLRRVRSADDRVDPVVDVGDVLGVSAGGLARPTKPTTSSPRMSAAPASRCSSVMPSGPSNQLIQRLWPSTVTSARPRVGVAASSELLTATTLSLSPACGARSLSRAVATPSSGWSRWTSIAWLFDGSVWMTPSRCWK